MLVPLSRLALIQYSVASALSDADMASNGYCKEGKVSLSAAYKISVYATADGYTASVIV